MADQERDNSAVSDMLGDNIEFTLELHRKHLSEGRYLDANECLQSVYKLTEQLHYIEDHPAPFWQRETELVNIKSPSA